MSARDRLAGKAPRRVEVRVQVRDPEPDLDALARAQALLLAAQADAARVAELPALEESVRSARAAVDDAYEVVAFTALPSLAFEGLVSEHAAADGSVARDALLPVLAAACADDEDLRDPDWWTEQLFAPTSSWTSGERDELHYKLFTVLHYTVPAGGLGKG